MTLSPRITRYAPEPLPLGLDHTFGAKHFDAFIIPAPGCRQQFAGVPQPANQTSSGEGSRPPSFGKRSRIDLETFHDPSAIVPRLFSGLAVSKLLVSAVVGQRRSCPELYGECAWSSEYMNFILELITVATVVQDLVPDGIFSLSEPGAFHD